MKSKILLIYSWAIRSLLFFLPDIPILMRFRGFLYGLGMESCGRDFQVTHDAIVKGLQNISVGKHVFIGDMTVILARGEICIEDEVMLAPHVVVISSNHSLLNGSFRYGPARIGPIRICSGSWIAANCTVAKGAKLPQGSVLSANSFLNKSYDSKDSIYAGTPAIWVKSIK